MGASSRSRLIRIILATVATAFGLAIFAGPASAQDTVWLCKPGQDDNPCAGTLAGERFLPPDNTVDPPLPIRTEALEFTAAENSPVDCFYLYPTQSPQTTPNADLAKDQPIRGVAVNQARMFSRICDVYAPMYRQITGAAPFEDAEYRDIAYNSALDAWNDYMDNYNDGRGVVVIGHSQGAAHMARLLAEEVDNDPAVRDKVISAILPGAKVYVPKGEVVGGQFQNIPACEAGDQVGCVIAYSMYNQQPGLGAAYGWIEGSWWINPAPRPVKDLHEVLCVNPAQLSGDEGALDPIANLPAFVGVPEGAAPWQQMPDFYQGECRSVPDEVNGTVSWLNVDDIRQPGDNRQDITQLVVGGGGNLHTADVNLALGNLISIAATQSQAFVTAERAEVVKKRGAVRKQLKAAKKKSKKLSKKARKARKLCARKGKACSKAKRLGRQAKKAKRKQNSLKKRERALTGQIKTLVGPAI